MSFDLSLMGIKEEYCSNLETLSHFNQHHNTVSWQTIMIKGARPIFIGTPNFRRGFHNFINYFTWGFLHPHTAVFKPVYVRSFQKTELRSG